MALYCVLCPECYFCVSLKNYVTFLVPLPLYATIAHSVFLCCALNILFVWFRVIRDLVYTAFIVVQCICSDSELPFSFFLLLLDKCVSYLIGS
jgi:hypothetical protein